MTTYNASDMDETELAALQDWVRSLGEDPTAFAAEFRIEGRTLHLTRHLRNANGNKYLVPALPEDVIASEPHDVELTEPVPAWLRAHGARVTRGVS